MSGAGSGAKGAGPGARLRVAIHSEVWPPAGGGAERKAERLARALAARGHEVTVLTLPVRGLPAREEAGGVRILRPGSAAVPGARGATATAGFAGALLPRARGFDAVHGFLLSPRSALGALWALRTGGPFLLSPGSTGPHGDLHGYLRPREWKGRWVWRLVRGTARFVASSRDLRAELEREGVPPSRIVDLPNPVDLDRFRPAAVPERERLRRELGLAGPVAIFVGRLVAAKGLDRLWAAWPEVRRRVPGAELLVLGEGELAASLARTRPPGARLVGKADPLAALQACDLFVLPSRSESMSNALLEAMACGLPVVAAEAGGVREQVDEGVTGWVVREADDPGVLAEAIARGLAPGTRESLGAAGRRLAGERHRMEPWVEALEGLYAGRG